MLGFTSMENVAGSRLAASCAPLSYCTEVKSDTTAQKYGVTASLIHFCPFQESFKETLFSSADIHMKNSIANSVLLLVKNSTNNGLRSKHVSNTYEAVVNLVNYSSVLQKAIKSRCNEALTFREKRTKDYCFNINGYCTKIARRTRDDDGLLDGSKLSKMKIHKNGA